jgi:anti-sigma B factor antagonist
MQLTTTSSEGVTVIKIEGSLDTQTSSEAQEELDRLVDDGARKLLIDFAELAYISSAGLRVLLATAKKLHTDQGEMRMCNMNDVVSEVFEVSGFSTIFKVFPTDSEAMAEF